MDKIIFEVSFKGRKKLRFSSEIKGLVTQGKEFFSGVDGILVYQKVKNTKAKFVSCQLSTNTSTLIPALKVLGIPYNSYFDKQEVIQSQNNITFYWESSQLAAFYNRFSTDELDYNKREFMIRKALGFLTKTANQSEDFLPVEYLKKTRELCKLLGFYQGFPIFDGTKGMPKLHSRLGIHIEPNSIMISTPMDKYAEDIEKIASLLEKKTNLKAVRKKNRVKFEKTKKLLGELRIKV